MTDDNQEYIELLQNHLSHFTNTMRGLITDTCAATSLLKCGLEAEVTLSDSEKRELFEAIQHSCGEYATLVNHVLNEQRSYQVKHKKKEEKQ